ncbi:ABC transporter ATP-binding protein [Desulfosarcina ovata subsp. sediminis]|uniref:Nickel import system ATP-binding protein NikD n=1 Tax=Desulfosarcina ovata subsp. sediminis TaxID=885957 RepID=A0A5K7ZM78_9BACT|nr:ABC transporter ATP-binding protein [Desulfosarcina ovata]BBO82111.1 ABC transporter ATP-binding protein [Desulfosarcina ovata subsp. sediminis]
MSLLHISNLDIGFHLKGRSVTVVDGIELELARGERATIIGESGCGKSLIAMALLGILPSNATVRGSIYFGSQLLTELDKTALRRIRATRIGYVPQSAATCLNPVFRFETQAREVLHAGNGLATTPASVSKILARVGLVPAVARMYPHQLSEGMKGRALVGLGTCRQPELLVADEPTKGLDNDAKADLVALLRNLAGNGTRSLFLITHDLDVARALPGKLAVMYAGHFVEIAPSHTILEETPLHPYTKGLLRSHPSNGLHPMPGRAPEALHRPTGCRFVNRCARADAGCMRQPPSFRQIAADHWVRCHHV